MRSHRFECECDACYRKFMDNINNFDEGALLRMKRECEQLAAANTKIAELEPAANTLRQLKELLEDGWVFHWNAPDAFELLDYGGDYDNKKRIRDKDLSAAIAAAYAAKEE